MTYPQEFVRSALLDYSVPFQVDNTNEANAPLLARIHHIWTPDLRVVTADGDELYRWDGFLPPAEFVARFFCAVALAHLRQREFDAAEALYVRVLREYSTTYAAPEAQYYLGVTRYRRDPETNELLVQWANLRSHYPLSEYRMKQSFKEMPHLLDGQPGPP